jgi:uncharacterized protein YfbU (UPF0304 family)
VSYAGEGSDTLLSTLGELRNDKCNTWVDYRTIYCILHKKESKMTEEQIINIAWNIFPISDKKRNENFIALLVHFARKIAEKEREECAKLCDESEYPDGSDLAHLIRARGQE